MSKKQVPAPSRGKRFEELEKTVKSLQASLRMMQLMQQQMANAIVPMQQDMSDAAVKMQTIHYTLIAMQDLLSMDTDALNKQYSVRRLADYEEMSQKDDNENGYTPKDQVESDEDIVILSSVTPDHTPDKGVFRSKMQVKELGPDLVPCVINTKVGDTFEYVMKDVKHIFTIEAIRQVPEKTEESACACEEGAPCDENCKCKEETVDNVAATE